MQVAKWTGDRIEFFHHWLYFPIEGDYLYLWMA